MVAKNKDGKPTQVPGLILKNKEEIKRFLEVIKRKQLKTRWQQASCREHLHHGI